MKTMRAVGIHRYGGPEVLVYEDIPRPHPGAGEVLVRVHAAGINPVDWEIREGQLKKQFRHTLPLVLGWDVSGVVEALGPGSTKFDVGDEVFSRPDIMRDGAYAEFIIIRESEVALKPKSIDHLHACAIPLAGLTAWQTLIVAAKLTSSHRVLIHGASGGVGTFAVQLAKWKGAHVIGTARAKNHDLLKKLGVDQVIDYETVRFEEVVEPVDVVLDTVGGEVQKRSWQVLKPDGILISIVSAPSPDVAAAHRVRQAFVSSQPDAIQLGELAKLVDEEKLKALVDTVLALSDATRGQELSQRGHVTGKIVLRVI